MQNDQMFLENLRKEVDNNLTNQQFGVEELARKVGLSRSQLHRKLNAATGQSVSQFIREHRLQHGMELLRTGEFTASEVAEQIGFGSATYFNSSFNEYYGYPPGEVRKRMLEGIDELPSEDSSPTVKKGAYRKTIIFFATGICLLLAGVFIYSYWTDEEQTDFSSEDRSIAILPFKNLSEYQKNEYFCDGIIEAIRTSLSHVNQLRVISRTSVEQYRTTSKSSREIASELGVAKLLEGSVQRNGDKVRIEVRLIDGVTEAQIWANTYDHELKDVFAIQSEIARQVVAELNTTLTAQERKNLALTETENPEAYDLYLKGIYEYRTYTNKGIHNSIALLQQAIALDSGYALAYAGLANSYIGLASIFGAELNALTALEKGKPLIDKALQLDPALDEALMLLGFYRLYHDWDFAGAEASYKLSIDTDYPDALALYADFLNFMSRHDEAMKYAERLHERYPYYPNSRIILSYVYNERLDDALKFSESRLKLFNNYYTFDSHGFLLLNMKRYKEAIDYFNKAIDLEGVRYPRMLGWMGAAFAKSGERDEAKKIITELTDRLEKGEQGSISFFIAVIYSALNEKEAALSWLQTAYDNHDMEMPWLMTEPQFYNLRQEEKFIRLAKVMNFPQVSGESKN